MYQVGVDHINKLLALSRQMAARGGGVDVAPYGAPYPGSSYTIVNAPAETPAPAKGGGLLKSLAAAALLGTGLGGAGAAAFFGGAEWLKGQVKAPEVKPIDLQFKAKFDPDSGLQVVPVEPPK